MRLTREQISAILDVTTGIGGQDADVGRGAPDWVVEVLSPRTAVKDRREKRDAYERAGVGEYWLVHPTDRTLTIYRLTEGAYGRPEVQSLVGETAVTAVAGFSIAWPSATAEGDGPAGA